ncbi:MAG: hypothetical protein H7Z14_09560 [Anaerolineae bacterium]|nr:hypothetical protein [Phycisphaerae bacterium]
MLPTQETWQPVRILRDQFESNVAALAWRDAKLAEQMRDWQPSCDYLVGFADRNLRLAKLVDGKQQLLPNPVPATSAAQIAKRLFPSGRCSEPVIVAGLDQGWLWATLFKLEIHTPSAPGHTPPLYFLTADLERLWVVLHLHDWKDLITDGRTLIFAGADCVAQAQQHMAANLHLPIPKLSVTVDPQTWANGSNIDSVTSFAVQAASNRLRQTSLRLDAQYSSYDAVDSMTNSSRPLRIMGITSRFTTFLQYSMRDWLEAFESLGHDTLLVIEPQNAAQFNALTFADECQRFKPDMIVMIDHFRGEFAGLPTNIPFVMWIQDQLPHIFSNHAGESQKAFDYTIGYGRDDCVHSHGYPSERFMPAMVGTNPRRFVPRRIRGDEYDRFACDVSFVSHCSTPAKTLLEQEIARQSAPESKRLLESIFDKLNARYEAGESVTMRHEFNEFISASLAETKLHVDNPAQLLNIFSHKINNAMFRHQTLRWLAELDVRLNLYGRGWENNPEFSRFARGVADNESQLSAIYQSSKINVQVSPFGAAHQRVFDGLAAGGFFLLRACPGDRADRIYRDLWDWCVANDVRSDAQLRKSADATARGYMEELTRINNIGPLDGGFEFMPGLAVAAAGGFTRNASTLWTEYDRVAFAGREELHERVGHFLYDDADRAQVTRGMRDRVLECMTYKAVAKQTMEFVTNDLLRQRAAGDDRQVMAA